jgi:hypothetical protein
MRFPFVTLSHHEEMVSELRGQIAEKESERQKYLDILAQMGWGVKIFGTEDQPETEETPEAAQTSSSTPTVPLSRMRPSQAARVITAQKQRQYDEKIKTVRKTAVLDSVAAIINGELQTP